MMGVDVSHWQGNIDWKRVAGILDKEGNQVYQFAFAKCSQGTTIVDPMYKKNKAAIRAAGLLFGAYHFAGNMPGGGKIVPADPVAEADHFLKLVGDLQPGEIVVLDYETYELPDPASWCLQWLQRVEEKLGFKPILYTYHGILTKYNWKKVSDNDNGLWAARYGWQTQTPMSIFKPFTASWLFYAIWQFCSKGSVSGIVGNVDLNTTDMNVESLKKYGAKAATNVPAPVCNKSCPVHCK